MLTEAEMHEAVRRRDPAYDGRFVYGVLTTGIYCRPTCAARRARPENLRFFADAAIAADAGFRACKRCRPNEARRGLEQVVAAARYIEAHSDERIGLDHLAARTGLSTSQLRRAFKTAFGVSPKAYQDAVRMRTFTAALKGREAVSRALYGAGFGSSSRLYGVPARHIGMTPSAYRAGGAGERIAV